MSRCSRPALGQRLLHRVRQRGGRAGRARVRRALGRPRRRGRGDRARAGVRGSVLVVDIEPQEAVGRRLRDVRRRSLESERETVPDVPVVHIGSPHTQSETAAATVAPLLEELEQMRLALELGLRDYTEKNSFGDVVVSVSGGIDSALTAALACEALGPDRIHCVSMPSRFSSEGTQQDARRLAQALGAHFLELPIESIVERFLETLAPVFEGREPDTTEENLQARVRGVQLMALSNKSAGSSSRPGTSRSSRSATRPCTATWPGDSHSSRTCSRPTCSV